MSKTPSRPIILKKDDSQRPARTQAQQPVQPKILTKSSNKDNVPPPAAKKISDQQEAHPLPTVMKSCHRLLHPHFQVDQKVFDFLDSENTDFLVVSIIGLKNVGKSSLANIISKPDFLKISDTTNSVTFLKEREVFSTSGVTYEGNTLDLFVTQDRIIFLDSSPLISNAQRRDMVTSECDDIKTLTMLIQLCHLILVVHEGFPDTSVARLLKTADEMVPTNIKHRPVISYIANKVQPGTSVKQFDSRIHDGANLLVPDLFHAGLSLHHDTSQVIQLLQERVFMMKRWSMMDSEEEVFTEKKWGQRLVAVMDQIKNDFFLRKYELLRDKFHQPVENC